MQKGVVDSFKVSATTSSELKMPAYNPLQKQAIQQFVAVTSAKESVAARTLKSHDWKVDQAINA